jgi:membrane-bound serine protease (ClpP class)
LKLKRFSLFLLLTALLPLVGWSQKVFVLDLQREIDPGASWYVSRGFAAAEAAKADLVVLHINTYGGNLLDGDSIRSRILASPIRTAAFIDRNAASAGALIALACDSIFMAPGSSIGAATVVNGDDGLAAPDKYQSYMRGIMRATATQNGRDGAIAEKMVDQNLEIPGLSPAGAVITFTTEEAIAHGYSEGTLSSVDEVVARMGGSKAERTSFALSSTESIVQWLVSPWVSIVLLILIFGGLFLELKAPGKTVPGLVAILATGLYFATHYAYGLADVWEVLVFGVGLLLLAFEIFVTPGFGVPGVLGLIFTLTGVVGGLIPNDGLDFQFIPLNEILKSIAMALVSMATAIILVVWVASTFIKSKRAYPFVDETTLNKESGYTAAKKGHEDLIGQVGVADTDLKPAGFILIGEQRYDASSTGAYLVKGTAIKVVAVKSTQILVELA